MASSNGESALDVQPLEEKTKPQVLLGGDSEELAKDAKRSGAYYKKVREMRRHPTVALARKLAVAPLLAAQWSIEAKEGAPPDAKQIISDIMLPVRLHLLRTSMFGCGDFGWQPYEKVFMPDANTGKVGIKKIKPLLQDFTKVLIDPTNGSYAGLLNGDETRLEIGESLLVNIDVEGTNWYGAGTLENVEIAYDNWNLCNDANVRYDRKIAGAHWIIHYPKGKSIFQGQEIGNDELAVRLLKQLESSGSFIVPKQIEDFVDDSNKDGKAWEIELKSAYPTSNVAFLDRLTYLDKLMVRAFGLPERSVLEGTFGTKAEAEAHADFAITNMELNHQLMVQQYNWHLVNHLLRINWGEGAENLVHITVSPLADIALSYLRQLYSKYFESPAGAANEGLSVDFPAMRKKLGIPELAADESPPLLDPAAATKQLVSDILPKG